MDTKIEFSATEEVEKKPQTPEERKAYAMKLQQNKIPETPEEKRSKHIKLLYFVCIFAGLIGLSAIFVNFIIGFLLLFGPVFLIWLHPEKSEQVLVFGKVKERILKWKDYTTRKVATIVVGSLILFVVVLASIAHTKAYMEDKAKSETPRPIITITSTGGNVGKNTGYVLSFMVKNADVISINGNPIDVKTGESAIYSQLFELKKERLSLSIHASNKYRSGESSVVVTREKTDQEIQIEKERIMVAKKENERAIKESIDRKNKEIREKLEKEIKDIQTADFSKYHSSIDEIIIEIALFGAYKNIIEENKDNQNQEIKNLVKKLEKSVINLQVREFPILRKVYAGLIDEKMREYNMESYVSGKGNKTFTLVSSIFVNNKNIKETNNTLGEMYRLLRFTKVIYKRSESSYAEYTYYDLDTPKDSEIE